MSNKLRELLALAIAIALPLAVGGLSSLATTSSIPTWYRQLNKPPWTPPGWLFGPVWTLLYVSMGVAAWLVWRRGTKEAGVPGALGLFALQIALNGVWTVIFFGLRAPGWALAEIVVLWAAIVATTVQFYRLRPAAGLLLVPYLLWVSFAVVLNAAIRRLNM